jgi:hypothetical protein
MALLDSEENEMGPNNEEGDRDKGDMMDEEHQHEYIAELEHVRTNFALFIPPTNFCPACIIT